MSEEEKREAISNIRYLYGLTYDVDAELREKMQEKINCLEKLISNLLDLYNKEKEKNQNALKWINNFMDDRNTTTTGCNLGDLMILLDILEEE